MEKMQLETDRGREGERAEGDRDTEKETKKWREQRIYPEKQAPTERDPEKDVRAQLHTDGGSHSDLRDRRAHACYCLESSPLGADGRTASFVCVFVSSAQSSL